MADGSSCSRRRCILEPRRCRKRRHRPHPQSRCHRRPRGRLQLVSVTVAFSFGDVGASTVVNLARSVANTVTGIKRFLRSRPRRHRCRRCRHRLRRNHRTRQWRLQLVSVTVAVASGDFSASTIVDGARARYRRCRHRASPTQSSTSSQMPSLSASAAQDPPQTPRASSWFPLQSHSPAGMSAHPQS